MPWNKHSVYYIRNAEMKTNFSGRIIRGKREREDIYLITLLVEKRGEAEVRFDL